MKHCIICGTLKPIDDYYAHPKMRDGHINKCKECAKMHSDQRRKIKELDPIWMAKEASRHRAKTRKAYAAGVRYDKAGESSRRYSERNPQKKWCHSAVNNAVRDGRLLKMPCEKCGNEKSEAHHDDYTRPLDVRWLCRKHHMELHRKYPEIEE